MKKLLLIIGIFPVMIFSLFLTHGTAQAAATERGFIIQYQEPGASQCAAATQLKPISSPVMCLESIGNEAQQKTCNVTKDQMFAMVDVSPAGSGLFQLKSRETGLCLRMGSNPGDSIIQTGCANAAAGGGGAQDQIFRIGTSPSAIQSNTGAGGLCLDVSGGGTVEGKRIQAWGCHGGTNQQFSYALDAGGNCPLDDLAGTKIYMDVISDGIQGTVDTIPPTAKTGGGTITKEYCVPILDTTTAKTIEIQVTAFDEAGNESEKTPKLIWPVAGNRDCTPPDVVAPTTPTNFEITN